MFGTSRIVMKQGGLTNELQAHICNAEVVAETANLVRAMNTGDLIIFGTQKCCYKQH